MPLIKYRYFGFDYPAACFEGAHAPVAGEVPGCNFRDALESRIAYEETSGIRAIFEQATTLILVIASSP